MKPIHFEEKNIVFGENQEEYQDLPAHKAKDGTVTMCIEFSEDDKKHISETGKIWVSMLTFNNPLQPLRFATDKPIMERNYELENYLASLKRVEKKNGKKIIMPAQKKGGKNVK